MFAGKLFIAMSRGNKLVFTGFAAVDVIVGVEEGSIGKHPWHFPALMYDRESGIFIYFFDLYMLLEVVQQLVLVVKIMNKLLWRNSIGDDF